MADLSSHLPPLNSLRAFEVAGRHLNFRLAAEELGVTQGAVAQHVRGLEAALGLALFTRLPRALALTDAGRAYLASIRRAFELIGDATAALRPDPQRLTISVTPSFASKWLIPRLSEFTAEHPLLELRILASESLASFQSDGVDIAVRQGRPPFGPRLTAELLFAQDIVAACSPALLADSTRLLTAAELGRFTLLHDAHNLWPEFLERALGVSPAMAAKGLRFNQTALAIEAAIAGQGLALASGFLLEQDIAAGRLVRALAVRMRGALDFYVVTPRQQRRPGATATVRTWLLERRSAASPEA